MNRDNQGSALTLGPVMDTPPLLTADAVPSASAESIITLIRTVLADGTMATAFQPIYDLATGEVTGAEALTRFRGGHGPAVWFALASAARLSVAMELAAVEAALHAAGQLPEHLFVSVNASPATCLTRRFTSLLLNSPVPAGRIVLEVTEHSRVDDYVPLLNALEPLRNAGSRVAVDDAGAGYASMLHIVRIAPDIIKLDKELIAGIDSNRFKKALGRAIVDFAREVGATVTAEGIETASELTAVTDLGITSGQGYFLGRPTSQPGQWARWHSIADQSADRRNRNRRGVPSLAQDSA